MSLCTELRGRSSERQFLSNLLMNARSGRSQVLLLRGEAGIGKTALLEFLIRSAATCRVTRAAGVPSEMDFAFASLHQLCSPFLDRLDELPYPQRDALGTTFGLQSGNTPDRFLIGLAVLTLLSNVAEEQPLLCVVDDAQWLDKASGQILGFVARRLRARRTALVFAARESNEEPKVTGLPELVLARLSSGDTAALLDSAVAGPLDPRIRERILAEAQGNPLAVLELARDLCSSPLTIGPDHTTSSTPLSVRTLKRGFLPQLDGLPQQARQVLLLAAADPVGDLPMLWRAARSMGMAMEALTAVETAGLLEWRDQVRFRHPLVRSAVYRAATTMDRRKVHHALAEVTDPAEDADGHAWHRARAAAGPDETVASELERSADRAMNGGGLAAAAGLLEAAALLTPDPARRAQRALDAAHGKARAGATEDALALLAVAQAGPLDDTETARVELLHAHLSLDSRHGERALPQLLSAARRLEWIHPELARETYLDALSAAMLAARPTSGEILELRQVAEALREVQLPTEPSKSDLLLRGLAVLYTDGYPAAAPSLHDTVRAFASDALTMDEAVRFAWLVAWAAADLWDDVNWDALTRRHLATIREAGALTVLPVALNSRVIYDLMSGDLAEAEALVAEARWVADVTGGQNPVAPYGEVFLSAMRGHASRAVPQIRELLADTTVRGEGVGSNMLNLFQAVLFNGLGRYEEALNTAEVAAAEPLELGPPKWALAELVEAGVHSGNRPAAATALEQLSSFARASGTELALGIEAGRRALLSRGDAAESSHREAIERLRHTGIRVEQAREQLRYGEWLRREGRRIDARTQLRTAHEALTAMGVDGFADRARRELLATGETVRKRTVETAGDLTAQEAHIARLAAEGLTNLEIGEALYISPRTVEWHLRKVFAKLDVTTRRQLQKSLPDSARSATPSRPGGQSVVPLDSALRASTKDGRSARLAVKVT